MKESKVKWTPKRPEPPKGSDEWVFWFYRDYLDRCHDKNYVESLRRERKLEEIKRNAPYYLFYFFAFVAVFGQIMAIAMSGFK